MYNVGAGSPPQVRGKHFDSIAETADGRITPAGAGKTAFRSRFRVNNGDHPRRCGENLCKGSMLWNPTGSPPQVRGKLVDAVNANHGDRITPAGAGKTQRVELCLMKQKDHPRRCGENAKNMYYEIGKAGSPPQVRGKHKRTVN